MAITEFFYRHKKIDYVQKYIAMILLVFVDKLNFKIKIDVMNTIIVLKILLCIYKVSPNS